MTPLLVSQPEPMIKVRVITVKDRLESTVKTLHKASTLHIEITENPGSLVYTSLEKELYTTFDTLIPIDDSIVCAHKGNHTSLEDNIKPICLRPFRETEILTGSVAVKWN